MFIFVIGGGLKTIPIEPLKCWGLPKIKTCIGCDQEYPYYKLGTYPGKNPKQCPECRVAYETLIGRGVGNATRRPMGHKTRQQHKRVNPKQI